MRLSTKLLTTLPSVAIVGVAVPTIASCSKKEYIINYGDPVNCRDKKDDNYQKIDNVKQAIRFKAMKAEKIVFTEDSFNDFMEKITSKEGSFPQIIYYDLIASLVLTNNETINLKNWKAEQTSGWYEFSFNLNGKAYPTNSDIPDYFYYFRGQDTTDKSIYLQLKPFNESNETELSVRSYMFAECQWA